MDGHERSDVVGYRQEVFLPAFNEIRPFLVTWNEEGQMIMPQNLPPGQKPLVLVTHDESTFSANDGKRRLWMENGKQPLRPKARGKGLMVSDFLTPGGSWLYLIQSRMLSWLHDFHLAGMLQSTSYTAKTNIGGEMTWSITQ